MNILLIGNGFDLAHDLPTSYMDFLKFVKAFEICNSKIRFDSSSISEFELKDTVIAYLKDLFSADRGKRTETINELSKMVKDNFWIQHFYRITRKHNWVDFESEISCVIQNLDRLRYAIRDKRMRGDRSALLNRQEIEPVAYLWTDDEMSAQENHFGYRAIKKKSDELLNDLERLIRALEIYLADCINAICVKKRSPDILNINVDYLLSFNYTNTYERLYADYGRTKGKDITYDFLHGKAKMNSSVENSNLVLGIDEYLEEPDRSRDNEFIRFKKFFQRIHKKTGCDYLSWIEAINSNPTRKMPHPVKDNLYIFGHSLDVTDGEVLCNLMLTQSVTTTVFYHDKEAYANQIANLVRVLGENRLISMVYGQEPKIKFVEQEAMQSC